MTQKSKIYQTYKYLIMNSIPEVNQEFNKVNLELRKFQILISATISYRHRG